MLAVVGVLARVWHLFERVLYEVLLHPCCGSGQCSSSRIVNCGSDKEGMVLKWKSKRVKQVSWFGAEGGVGESA